MKLSLPRIKGVIRRRLLVNFRVDPDVMQKHLPAPFRPKTQEGHAVAGICLIRLEGVRPVGFPRRLGLSSENAAHRVAVVWEQDGVQRQGVYIPRRDTGSLFNRLAGGHLFPGEHGGARFHVRDDGQHVELHMESTDGEVRVDVIGKTAQALSNDSIFPSITEASAFFEGGSIGFSTTAAGDHLDAIVLDTDEWRVLPLDVDEVFSSYFADTTQFPPGSVEFDCGLAMRNIAHTWVAQEPMAI